MPKNTFKRIFKIYNEKETDLKITIFKLMNYFNSPYIAVLLRLHLGIGVKNLIN